jgi:hypothetical protein
MMKKYLLLSFLTLWSAQLFAADTIALNPDNDLAVTGTTAGTTFSLNVVETTKTPTEDSPAQVYVPMTGPSSQERYFIEKNVTTLFSAASTTATVNFPLYLNVSATDQYLYIAIKNSGGDYRIAKQFSTTPFRNVTNRNEIFSVSSYDICLQAGNCGDFSSSGIEKAYLAYFFFSTTTGLSIGQSTATPTTTYPGGIFYNINMSNRIYDVNSITPFINKVRIGDKRLVVEYSSAANILKPKSIRILYRPLPSGAILSPSPIHDYYDNEATSTLNPTEFDYVYTGELTINNLANDDKYIFSLFFVDQYKFGTVLSVEASGTPLEIQELLKKNSCFLLTAGFGEDHYVISYFRHFRDAVLSQSYLGRAFISAYYETAPKYALMIYQHEGIRAVIRGLAYALYFIFNFYYVFIAGAAVIGAALVYRKRDKFRHSL